MISSLLRDLEVTMESNCAHGNACSARDPRLHIISYLLETLISKLPWNTTVPMETPALACSLQHDMHNNLHLKRT